MKKGEKKLSKRKLVALLLVLLAGPYLALGTVSAEEDNVDPIEEFPSIPVIYDFSVEGYLSDTNDFLHVDVLSTSNCVPGNGLVDLLVTANGEITYSGSVEYSTTGETVGIDLTGYLIDGRNEVYMSIDSSNVSYRDSNPDNDVFELFFDYDPVSEPSFATDIIASDLVLDKDGAKGAIVSFSIEAAEGSSLSAEEVVVEIYDKWGELVYYDILYDIELSYEFSVSSSEFSSGTSWSDLMGMTAKVYIPGEENMEENELEK